VRKDNLPRRVLVVDDDPLTCELVREILHSAGMEASSLTNSAQAAERVTREKYHAVFVDMRMPAPDGVELARHIRASRVNADVPRFASLKEWFGGHPAEELTPKEIEHMLASTGEKKKWAPSTFNHYRSCH
jgi:chemotaxis response regulator CheB